MIKADSYFLAERLSLKLPLNGLLGEGGQGAVYQVITPQGPKAVKWYNLAQSTALQRKLLHTLVKQGPPKEEGGERFIWPLDLVTHPEQPQQFGYLMDFIERHRFISLGEMWAGYRNAPSFRALLETSWQVANSYYALHINGYCYRDISTGNVLFDPKSGHVRICDNDNICIDQQTYSSIWGTLEFMAPELILGQVTPSSETDSHALAVWLFLLWVWHHPLHGLLESQIRSWDLPARRYIYGANPVFIFDPDNALNKLPDEPDYETARIRWPLCPPALQRYFMQAFTKGLKDPAYRVTETQWQRLFLQLQDGLIRCPHDQAENIWSPETTPLYCWHCHRQIPLPPQLRIEQPHGRHCLLLTNQFRLLERHVNPLYRPHQSNQVIGDVIQHPHDHQVWGLRNLSQEAWTLFAPDGTSHPIEAQKSVPLRQGTCLRIHKSEVWIDAPLTPS